MDLKCKFEENELLKIEESINQYKNIVPNQVEVLLFSTKNDSLNRRVFKPETFSVNKVLKDIGKNVNDLSIVYVNASIITQTWGTNIDIGNAKIFFRFSYSYRVNSPSGLRDLNANKQILASKDFMRKNYDKTELAKALKKSVKEIMLKRSDLEPYEILKEYNEEISNKIIDTTKLYLLQNLGIEIIDFYTKIEK